MIHGCFEREKRKRLSDERLWCVLKAPLLTEKAVIKEGQGEFFFKVDSTATKVEIKRAVEKIFSVKVASVNTLVMKGKSKRFRGIKGKRSGYKKAMVRLGEGEALSFDKVAL